MAANSNALLRHKIIDNCLRDTQNKYTLRDLIDACTKGLQERHNNTNCKASVRTVQLDIQTMRDPENGYGAPIVVYDNKYYSYSDPTFSINKTGINTNRLSSLQEAVNILKEYGSFNGFEQIKEIVSVLDEEILSKNNSSNRAVCYEKKKSPLGLEYFNIIYDAIINKKVLCIGYWSSRSNNIMPIIFYPMYLKEYKGRWYAMGYKDGLRGVYKLPIDRIRDFSYAILPFPEELHFDAELYFKDIIGVTKLSGEIRKIKFLVRNKIAPFIRLNPLHDSQQVIQVHENGDIEFEIAIIPNREFYNIIFEYQPYIEIISPREIGIQANAAVTDLIEMLPDYTRQDKAKDGNNVEEEWDDGFNLFSELAKN